MRLKREDGECAVSDITKHVVDEETFGGMEWNQPIIRHFDGEMYHFISLVPEYLEVLKDGIFIGSQL
jgi:hypothetical protein